jgi:hypothetical protein
MKVDKLFENFSPLLKEKGADMVKKVGNVYHFEILKQKGYMIVYYSAIPIPQYGLLILRMETVQ